MHFSRKSFPKSFPKSRRRRRTHVFMIEIKNIFTSCRTLCDYSVAWHGPTTQHHSPPVVNTKKQIWWSFLEKLPWPKSFWRLRLMARAILAVPPCASSFLEQCLDAHLPSFEVLWAQNLAGRNCFSWTVRKCPPQGNRSFKYKIPPPHPTPPSSSFLLPIVEIRNRGKFPEQK